MSRLRIRTIKPEFFADERVNGLPIPCRYLTLGLITRADDRGRQRRQDAAIAAHVFPEADVATKTVGRMIDKVVAVGIALAYVVEGHGYLWLPNFWKHQVINKPSESDLPPCPEDPFNGMAIRDALIAFRDQDGIATGKLPEFSRSSPISRARPFGSVPSSTTSFEQQPQLTRETVDEATTLLAARWPDEQPATIENCASMYPGVDLLQGCRLALAWASDPSWTTKGCGATLRSALRKLDSERKAPRRESPSELLQAIRGPAA